MSQIEFINLYNYKIIIPRATAGVSNSDVLYVLPEEIVASGRLSLESFNLCGNKSVYTINTDLVITTVVDGAFKATITIPNGVYDDAQLTTLICGASKGIIKDTTRPNYLIAADTTKLLSIRFNTNIEDQVVNLLGLQQPATNQSGSFVQYDLPLSGLFPSPYNFTSTDHAVIEFGFSQNVETNISNIPITDFSPDALDLSLSAEFNQYSSSLLYNNFICNIPGALLKSMRIRLSDYLNNSLIYNLNDIVLFITIADRFITP
jgi:hypothetical protein